MGVERAIRGVELLLAAVSTYLSALLLVKSGLYQEMKGYLSAILSTLGLPLDAYMDMLTISAAVILSLHLWRRGSESSYAHLFSLNLLMFFPAVLDYSLFNWVELILPYNPNPGTPLLTFSIGLLLQATYLTIRSTLLVRHIRDELLGRGAEPEDVDVISKGQMAYLTLTLTASALILAAIYLALPYLEALLLMEVLRVPYTHIIIGVSATLLIALATLFFLRGWRR
jgi:hypothetical protein